MSTTPTVWHGVGERYHATESCAGADGVPVFEEFVVGSDLEPCGVCQPGERFACRECGRVYIHRNRLRTHVANKHRGNGVDRDESAERFRELEQKARGESDD